MFAAPLRIVVVLFLLGGCAFFESQSPNGGAVPGPPATLPEGEGVVLVANIAYNPDRVEVTAGDEVVWTIDDGGVSHTVTADDGSFDSGRLSSGEFRSTFDTPGEVPYHCEVHARMKGTVVVTS